MTAQAQTATTTSIDPGTTMGLLSLTVADLPRSLGYYTKALGFEVLRESESDVTLGAAGVPLLLLTEHSGAQPWPRGGRSYTGLYHFAILMPTRADLGRWLRHWFELGFTEPGQGDHRVSEALYLEDPDGHGIEIYRDRPRGEWEHSDGRVQMGTGPVDIAGLLADAQRDGKPWIGMPAGTTLGHVHLQVGDIPEAARFYHEVLGFDIMGQMPTALFISAGGYHHHIGMNVWHSAGAGPAPSNSVRLRFFTVDLPNEQAREEVISRLDSAGVPHDKIGDTVTLHDPWQNQIMLRARPASDAKTAEDLAAAASS
jgi:catechol 2,3-dioxygenase